MTDVYEADFSEFGYRELDLAKELIDAYLKSNIKPLGGLKVGFNANSGNVFLTDEDNNAYMMNDDKLEQFYDCPICGTEGFFDEVEDLENHTSSAFEKDCIDWIRQIKGLPSEDED